MAEFYVDAAPDILTRSVTVLYPIESKTPRPQSCLSNSSSESSRFVRIEDNSHTVELLHPVRVIKELYDDRGECALCNGTQEVRVVYEDDEEGKSSVTEYEANVVDVDELDGVFEGTDIVGVRTVVEDEVPQRAIQNVGLHVYQHPYRTYITLHYMSNGRQSKLTYIILYPHR